MKVLQLRDGLIAVAFYFAWCALVSDAHQASQKESTMNIATPSLAPAKNPALSRWHPHTDEPNCPTRAIILIQPNGADPVTLPELYVWDVEEGYWISASSHLRIRHKEFQWAELYPMLEIPSAPATWRRDEEATAQLLDRVGIHVDADAIAVWQPHQVRHAEEWAAAVHLHAADSAVPVPPMPMFLRDYQGNPS